MKSNEIENISKEVARQLIIKYTNCLAYNLLYLAVAMPHIFQGLSNKENNSLQITQILSTGYFKKEDQLANKDQKGF